METSTTNKSLNYSANQTTISGNNTVTTSTDTATSQSLNTTNTSKAETDRIDFYYDEKRNPLFIIVKNLSIKEYEILRTHALARK